MQIQTSVSWWLDKHTCPLQWSNLNVSFSKALEYDGILFRITGIIVRLDSHWDALCLVRVVCSVKVCSKKEYISHNALRMWAVQREAEVEVDFELVVI